MQALSAAALARCRIGDGGGGQVCKEGEVFPWRIWRAGGWGVVLDVPK
jgi:hypothetical protein